MTMAKWLDQGFEKYETLGVFLFASVPLCVLEGHRWFF